MIFSGKFRFVHESPRKGRIMYQRLCKALIALVAIFGASLFAFAAPASADTTCTTDSNGNTFCNTSVQSVSYSDGSSSVLSVASSDVAGKVNLRFQVATGFKTSATCVKRAAFSQVPRWAKCWTATKWGYHFSNSGVSRSGVRRYFDDFIGSKYSPVGSKFYWDAKHSTWRKANCGNFVRFTGNRPALKVASVALVKTFSKITVSAKSVTKVTETVMSQATCQTASSSASATAYGTGTAWGSATATASAWTYTAAKTAATSTATSNAQASGRASAYSAAQVDMYTKTSVSCSSSTQQQTPPSVVSMTQLNDVDAGGTSPNFCATVNVPGSDSGTLTFSAQFGSFATSTFTVNGEQQECTTYVAPTEVPSGGNDTITVFVRDNNTGLSAQQSETFPINSPPPPPA